MKKKILIFTLTLSVVCGGVVSAASIWGTYKGNQIIRITSEGKQLRTEDVPAISYNGRTMIPISLLSQIGLKYTWDANNQTVDIKTDSQPKELTSTIKDMLLTANIFKGLEDLGEELLSVNQVYSTTMLGKVAGTSEKSNVSEWLNDAIKNYNLYVDAPNVKRYSSMNPEINTILNKYNESINQIKQINSVFDKMESTPGYKPDAKMVELYIKQSKSINELIYSGKNLATQKYTDLMYIATR